MNVPNKFITPLDDDVINTLEDLVKNSTKARLVHCQANFDGLLFSAKALALLPLKGENI